MRRQAANDEAGTSQMMPLNQRWTVHNDPELQEASLCTEQAIIQAEKFKTKITDQTGESDTPNFNELNVQVAVPAGVTINHQMKGLSMGEGLTDDHFFHLTCHIDQGLKEKIQRGSLLI